MRNLILSTVSTLAFLMCPLSLWAQNSFSLSLDVNSATGNQSETSLNTSADQVIAIQIFGTDIQNANGVSVRFEYDTAQVTYDGFEVGSVLPNAQALPEHGTNPTFVQIGIVSFGGQATVNGGLVGTIRFRTTAAFSGATIQLVRAELSRGGRFETITPNLRVELQTPPAPTNFSLSLDADSAAGDQSVMSLNTSADQAVAIQIFGKDIQNANGVSVRFEYDASQMTYEGFDVGSVLPNAQALPEHGTNPTFVQIGIVSFGGQATANSGLMGTIRFRTTAAFSGTSIRLVRAELSRGGRFETVTPDIRIELQLHQVSTAPSSDFDGNGIVNIADFLAFVGQFGNRQGDGKYDAKYDLDSDGQIAISDFLSFVNDFGKEVPPGGGGSGGSGSGSGDGGGSPDLIPDANLRAVIEAALGKASGAPITQTEMATLTRLDAQDKEIRDLTGLEFATNLTSLNLGGELSGWGAGGVRLRLDSNTISDISPLSHLTKLTSLNLSGNDISDFSPLSNLTNLTTLTLINTTISNLLPLTNLTSLTDLNLAGNDLSNSDFSPLTSLTSLTRLELLVTKISDVSKLSSLANLTSLDLSYNSISDISVLSGLTKLTSLNISWNSISDISVLSGLTKLTNLVLSGNSISDISTLSSLTKLIWLTIGNNSISDISQLSGLTNLTGLNLWYNSISDISALAGLTKLTSLTIDSNSISDISPLSRLTNLTWLTIGRNSISDISALAGLTSLEYLRLSNNSISDLTPLVSNTGLGSGDEVDVRRNPLSDTSLNTHIPALQARGVEVDFDNTGPRINDPTPVTIPDANLRAVIADSLGKASGATITKGDMSTLTRLEALNKEIRDLTGLEYATNLTYLDLTSNLVSDVSALADLTSLRDLYLSNNVISDVSALAGPDQSEKASVSHQHHLGHLCTIRLN